MPSLHTFHATLRDGQREAGPLEARLAAAYHSVIAAHIEEAATKLEHHAWTRTLVAATDPQQPPPQSGWTPPPAGTLIDVPALIAALQAETDPVRRQILEALVAATLDRFGISFDLSNPLLDGVFQQMGQNIQGIAETTRRDIMQAVQKSYDEGLSIPHAADEIRRVAEMSKTRATMIARTELIGASNGASLAAARLTEAAPYKTWLSAGDHRVREAHRIADGQTVPIAAPFLVGGEPLMFPGDQLNGTPDEVINCRCTLVYTDQAPMAIAAGGDNMSTVSTTTNELWISQTDTTGAYTASGLPIADRGRAWDASAAKKRVKSWSSSTDMPNAKYKSAFFAANGDTYGDCHLPFADVINGTLTAIPRGVFAAAGAVNGSRGASGYDSAKGAIASYYARMRKQFNDPKLTPPWQAANDALTYAMPTGLPVSDAPHGLEDITPGADWEATLLVEGSPTDDGRMIMPGATTWRTLPLTLMAMVETQPGHDGAVVAGRIDSIERQGQNIVARGVFDSGEFGQEIARLVKDETLRGISVDLAPKDVRATNSAGQELDLELATDPGDVYSTVFDGVVLGGTVCPMQAFADATIMTITASGTIGMALTAGAAGLVPLNPPSEWFDIPEPGEPTPLTVTEEGQVYGHAALWNTCHIGYPDECVPPPRSPSDYRFFHLGQVACSDNQTVTCGTVTLGTGHAPLSMSKSRAAEHYDNTGTAVADVRARDANLGVWVCGALRPDTPAERVRHLSAGKLSGDWRNIDGRLEMVGLLTVNVPGFPVPHPRAMVAAVMDGESHVESQEVTALVAAGILRDHPADVFEYQVNTLAALIDGGLETLITTIGDSGGERT